jgi:hypothetical protein
MADTATKKAAAKKTAASQPVQQGSYATLEDRPDADQGNGTLARNVHLVGDNGVQVFEAGTEAKDLPDWAMKQLAKNPKAWAHDDEDE